MAIFGFQRLDTARNLAKLERERPWTTPQSYGGVGPGVGIATPPLQFTEHWILKTPPDGIPPRSGMAVSSAPCTPYYISIGPTSTDLVELLDDEQNSQTKDVYNIFETGAVGGDKFIIAGDANGLLIVIAEEC